MSKRSLSQKNSNSDEILAILISLLIGLFWAMAPFFGWSEYSLEGAMISCSVEWNKLTPSVMSYNIVIILFVYFIPISVLIFTSSKAWNTVSI